MSWLRWARVRGVKEGKVQSGRVEVFESTGRDDAMRPQDYGFAALPVDGEGLVLEIGGHTIVLRQDLLASRPQMAAYDVCVWHKDGHQVALKSGKLVQIDCEQLVINAATSVTINTPLISAPTASLLSKIVSAATSLLVAGKEMSGHVHGGVSRGTASSDPPA